jgi:hypothetical protein
MTTINKYGFGVVLTLLVLAITPYLIAAFYSFPFADDYCFGWTAKAPTTLFEKVKDQYLYWNGRYTADLLVNLHPLKYDSIILYKLVNFFSILAFAGSAYLFFSALLSKTNRGISVLVALMFTFSYLVLLPNLTEGTYWYIGLCNYQWGNTLLMLQATALIYALRIEGWMKWLSFSVSIILLAISAGFNEVGAVVIVLLYFIAALSYRRNILLWLHLAVALGCAAILFLAPGNSVRFNAVTHNHNFTTIGVMPLLQTLRFTGTWILSVPVILGTIVTAAYSQKIAQHLPKVKWFPVALLLLAVCWLAFILPYIGTGILGQYRTANYILPFFLLLWFVLVVKFSCRYNIFAKMNFINAYAATIIISLAIIMGSMTRNSIHLTQDIMTGALSEYHSMHKLRHMFHLQHPDAAVISPIPVKLKSMPIVEVTGDSAYWVDKCALEYYKTISAQ